MESDLVVFQNVARVLALVGGGLSAIYVVWSGILWMTSAGDPQRMSLARNSLIGTVVGLVVVGCGFILPGIISDFVIEPSGGVAIEGEAGVDCDAVLRKQLVINRSVSTPTRMNTLIRVVQGRFDSCGGGFWTPRVVTPSSDRYPDLTHHYCFDRSGFSDTRKTIGGVVLPKDLWRPEDRVGATGGTARSGRDSQNNIVVYFSSGYVGYPSNGAICWLYLSAYDTWANGYD